MQEDFIKLNILAPGQAEPSVIRVQPTASSAKTHAISGEDASKGSGLPSRDEEQKAEHHRPVVEEGTFEQLDAEIALANKHLHDNGITINLLLDRDEEGVLHLAIEDHRATEGPVVRRVRIIEHHEITPLINDLLQEVGICIDHKA